MKFLLVIFFTCTCSILSNAQASSTTVDQTIKLSIRSFVLINLISATDTSVSLNNQRYYINGKRKASSAIFNVKSNSPWAVTIDTTTSLVHSAAGNTSLPFSNHKVSLSKTAVFYPLSNIPANVRIANINNMIEATRIRSIVYTASQK